jgi:transcriptional regulator with XRE-family HTH domain
MAAPKKRNARKGLYVRRVVGRNVKRLRKARGMNQEELADAAHMGQSQISNIENAKTNIRLDVLQSLASGLSVRLAELFEEGR